MATLRLFSLTAVALLSIACQSARATIVTFGSGVNEFDMEFVEIGNLGNAADTMGTPDPAGAVGYTYNMGKFEVSEDMINKANTLGSLGITKHTRGTNKPATGVSWNEAARFVNWLNTSQGYSPAYKFALQPGDGGYSASSQILLWEAADMGFDATNPFRNSLAHYFLPSVDEWYKAAYYNPNTSTYFDYPTGSDMAPTPVASGMTAVTAVYNGQPGLADVTVAGGLSPYGIMGMGGNVHEWEETTFDLMNGSSSSARGVRGGDWGSSSSGLSSLFRNSSSPASEGGSIGFRVVSVPEPSSLVLGALGLVGLLLWRRSLKEG